MKTFVMIPTYNEKDNIKTIIDNILSLGIKNLEIAVIDDNSPDGTHEIVKDIGKKNKRVHLVLRIEKKGRGLAGIEGYKYCIKNGADAIIEMDADFSHDPKYIPVMLSKIKIYDIVLGSRYVKGGTQIGRDEARKILTVLANFYIRLTLNLTIKDCNSGFRCFRRHVIKKILKTKFISDGSSVVQEVLYKCHKNGFSIHEIPIIFKERQKGASKLQLKHIWKGYLLPLRMKFGV